MKLCLMCRTRNIEHYGICPQCSELNEKMRALTCDLTGLNAVVTGGRIKIGYAACSDRAHLSSQLPAIQSLHLNSI